MDMKPFEINNPILRLEAKIISSYNDEKGRLIIDSAEIVSMSLTYDPDMNSSRERNELMGGDIPQ